MIMPTELISPQEARAWTARAHALGERVALVPTMGALHDGHLALVELGRSVADRVIVSIFVNPTQFNRADDFENYPRTVDDDLTRCATAGVDAIYLPTVDAMYPSGFDTRIEPGVVAERWEGAHRPGHFSGVATVVTKLLNACSPDVAIFGQKDCQQLAVIRRTVTDLDLGVEIIGAPTVREADGLAMSSRNRRLTPDARTAAVAIYRGLLKGVAKARMAAPPDEVEHVVRAEIEPAADSIEYVAFVNRSTFEPVEANYSPSDCALIVAAWFAGVRLIDNMSITSD